MYIKKIIFVLDFAKILTANRIRLVMILSFFCFARTIAYSQTDSTGIYMTAQDFINKKISFGVPCPAKRYHIRVNSAFDGPTVKVVQNEVTHIYNKSDIYGYRDCDNKVYRFFDNTEYTIVNTDQIFLYTKTIQESGDSGYVGELFFFSVRLDSRIIPMSKKNLLRAYPENGKFKDLINITFRNHENLDVYEKQYLIIRLYNQSLNSESK